MLTIDEIVQGCLAGCRRPDGAQAVVDVVRRAVSCPDELESALGPAAEAGETTVFASPELTVSRLVWAPRMSMYAHDHVNRGVSDRQVRRAWRALAVGCSATGSPPRPLARHGSRGPQDQPGSRTAGGGPDHVRMSSDATD